VTRALYANVMRGGVAQGGSTITQQLAKNLFLTPGPHPDRKVQEVALALWLEHKLSKPQILELYLNRVYFGAGAYGIEAAAQRYFGKPARADVPEAAMLAGPGALAVAARAEPQSGRRRTPCAVVLSPRWRNAGFITDGAAKTP
jgi:penicillin-binding protein 1A